MRDYIFPFDKVPKNKRIVLYGAGKVGQAFYRQLISRNYCKEVYWVDKRWKNLSIGVVSIESIDIKEVDYVIIAMEDCEQALKVRKQICELGVEDSCIIWNYPILPEVDICMQHENMKKELLLNKFPRIFIMNTADYGNIGDQAITIATYCFLKEFFQDYYFTDITGKQWDSFKDELKEIIREDDSFFIIGGGFMGDLWSDEDVRVKDIISTFPHNRFVFLPQTFYFDESLNEDTYRQNRMFYHDKENILVIHREEYSMHMFEKMITDEPIVNRLFPDMVLYMNEFKAKDNSKLITLCFREDKEKCLKKEIFEKILVSIEKKQYSYEMISTMSTEFVSKEHREIEYKNLLQRFHNSRLVITDRLHGMIFAAITGTPCIAFNNLSRKVEGVYKWLKSFHYIVCIDSEEFSSELVEQLLNMDIRKLANNNILSKFNEMAQEIRQWINWE